MAPGLSPCIYLGTGGYLISSLNVLPVFLPATKTTSYPTNRTSQAPLDNVGLNGRCESICSAAIAE